MSNGQRSQDQIIVGRLEDKDRCLLELKLKYTGASHHQPQILESVDHTRVEPCMIETMHMGDFQTPSHSLGRNLHTRSIQPLTKIQLVWYQFKVLYTRISLQCISSQLYREYSNIDNNLSVLCIVWNLNLRLWPRVVEDGAKFEDGVWRQVCQLLRPSVASVLEGGCLGLAKARLSRGHWFQLWPLVPALEILPCLPETGSRLPGQDEPLAAQGGASPKKLTAIG